jgi:hypothetical protein
MVDIIKILFNFKKIKTILFYFKKIEVTLYRLTNLIHDFNFRLNWV